MERCCISRHSDRADSHLSRFCEGWDLIHLLTFVVKNANDRTLDCLVMLTKYLCTHRSGMEVIGYNQDGLLEFFKFNLACFYLSANY